MKINRVLILLLIIISLSACVNLNNDTSPSLQPSTATKSVSTSVTKAEFKRITAEEAKKKIDTGGVVIVDVRTESEYQEKHIDGAILVPNETIQDTMPE